MCCCWSSVIICHFKIPFTCARLGTRNEQPCNWKIFWALTYFLCHQPVQKSLLFTLQKPKKKKTLRENDFIQDGRAASLHAPQPWRHRWHKPRMAWLQWMLPDIPAWTCELIIYMDEHHHRHWKTRASGAAPGHARGRWRSRSGRDWAQVPGEANLTFHYSEYTIRWWLKLSYGGRRDTSGSTFSKGSNMG